MGMWQRDLFIRCNLGKAGRALCLKSCFAFQNHLRNLPQIGILSRNSNGENARSEPALVFASMEVGANARAQGALRALNLVG